MKYYLLITFLNLLLPLVKSGNIFPQITRVEVLQYGDFCSPKVESERTQLNFKFLEKFKHKLEKEEFVEYLKALEKITESGVKLCSSKDLLVCDESIQRCVCGDPDFEAILGPTHRRHYVREWNSNKCRLRSYSGCYPSGAFGSISSTNQAWENCERGFRCYVVGEKDPCSLVSITAGLAFEHSPKKNFTSYMAKLLDGQFCTCRPQNRYEITYTNSSFVDSKPSLKRGLRALSSLKHNDSCSWVSEGLRQMFISLFAVGNKHLVYEIGHAILLRGAKLCSVQESLVCDKASQKCVCGDTYYEAFYKRKYHGYILEAGNCKRAIGQACYPETSKRLMRSFSKSSYEKWFGPSSMECGKGTKCYSTEENNFCSPTPIIASKYFNNSSENISQLYSDVFSGRLCSCRGDPSHLESVPNPSMPSFSSGKKLEFKSLERNPQNILLLTSMFPSLRNKTSYNNAFGAPRSETEKTGTNVGVLSRQVEITTTSRLNTQTKNSKHNGRDPNEYNLLIGNKKGLRTSAPKNEFPHKVDTNTRNRLQTKSLDLTSSQIFVPNYVESRIEKKAEAGHGNVISWNGVSQTGKVEIRAQNIYDDSENSYYDEDVSEWTWGYGFEEAVKKAQARHTPLF